MLAAYCPRDDATWLFSETRIRALANTPIGIEVRLECYCGEQIEFLTGITADEPATSPPRAGGRP